MEAFEPKNLPTEGGKKLQNKRVSKRGFVPFTTAIAPNQTGNAEIDCREEDQVDSKPSKVDIIEEEGVIKQILVTCSCGKVTKIDCLYEE